MFLSKSLARVCLVAATLGLALPIHAGAEDKKPQTATATPVKTTPAAAATQAPQEVTIFGHKRADFDKGMYRIDNTKASSCNFLGGYASDFHVSGLGYTGGEYSGLERSGGYADNSPFGNVAGTGGVAPGSDRNGLGGGGIGDAGRRSPCDATDQAFAAGRSYIARKDTSLKDALAAFDAKDYPKALDLFHKSYTKMGYGQAAFMIAKMNLYGLGTPKDTPQAIVWLRKLADFNMPAFQQDPKFDPKDPDAVDIGADAAMTMGKIYMTGWDGTPKDPKEAKKWFNKADYIGFVPGTHIMGLIYESGYGGDKDLAQAYAWLRLAGQNGLDKADAAAAEIAPKLTADDRAKAEAMLTPKAK